MAAFVLLSPAGAGATTPPAPAPFAISEALWAGTLEHHHPPRDALFRGDGGPHQYMFGEGGGEGRRSPVEGGGRGASVIRSLAVSEKGKVGASSDSGGGGGGDGSAGKKKEDTTQPKALEALVVGGNFTLDGKSTNVAQYDPVRLVAPVCFCVCVVLLR